MLVNGVKPYRAWGVYTMVYRYRGAGLGAETACIAEPLGPRSGRAVRTARRGVKSSRGGARGAGRASRRGVPARFRLRGSAFPPAPRAARPAGSPAQRRDVDDYPGAVTLLRGPGRRVGRRGGACVGRPRPVRGCRVKRVPVSRVGPQPSCRAERRLDGLESEGDPERIPRVRQETSNARDLFSAVLTCHRPPSTPLTCRPSCSAAECL